MDALTLQDLVDLARTHGEVRVSLYMPTRRFAPGSQEEDTTRLRNLLKLAEELLSARGLKHGQVDALLEPVRALAEERPFWLRSLEGLAVLAGPEGMRTFQVPVPVDELVWVGDRYHLRPLASTLDASRPFWLLALSQKQVRLLQGTGYGLTEVPAEGIPASLSDALRWDDYEKSSLQFHTGTSGSGGRRPAVFHGTGETDVKDEIVRYFRGIDRGLKDLLRDSDAPLVLAGVDYLLPLYRDVNSYPHLAGEALAGSPDTLGDAELHARAWPVVAGIFAAERRAAAARAHEGWASPRVTPDPETIVPAAHHGRIETLLLAPAERWWGTFDAESGTISVHPSPLEDDEDLLDRAAVDTLANGGTVVPLPVDEMPHQKAAVAVLRY